MDDTSVASEAHAAGADAKRRLAVSFFPDRSGVTVQTRELSWRQLVANVRSPRKQYERKDHMPLVKLARFGDVRSVRNSLRNDANVLAISGIEGDYDAEEVPLDGAATLLTEAGIISVLYTSPNHSDERPRWRVLCPQSRERSPETRREFVGRLNRILGGILASESFTLSQSYYIGRARLRDDGTPAVYAMQEVRGHRCIDEADEIEPQYPVKGHAKESAASQARNDPVLNALRDHRLLLRTIKPGAYAIRCPWENEHTEVTSDTATVYLQANFDGRSHDGFDCKHGHCAGRSLGDLLAFLGLSHKAREGATAGASGGEAPDGQGGAAGATTADLSGPPWPDPMDVAALHGIAGEFVRMIEPNTESDPAAILVQFLVAFGALVGRGPHFRVEGTEHHANLYVVAVGDTSKARKGTSWDRVREVFGLTRWNPPVSGLSSGEGLIYHVRDPLEGPKKSKKGEVVTEILDEGVADKRLLVYQSEFASVLRVAARDGNTLSAALREGWDSGNLRTLTKHDPVVATGAHICIVGHITADELRRELTTTDAVNGFANRFLFVAAKRSKLLPHGGADSDPDEVRAFAEQLNALADAARQRDRIRRSRAADAAWEKVYPALSAGGLGMHATITARAEAQTMRLALLYALLDGADEIDVPHLLAALAVWQYCDTTAKHIYGASLGDRIADEIMRRLRLAGDAGLSRNDIREAFRRNVSSERIGEALDLLQRRGLATCEKVMTEGRPAEVWRGHEMTARRYAINVFNAVREGLTASTAFIA